METFFKQVALSVIAGCAFAFPVFGTELTVTVTTDGAAPAPDGTVLFAHNQEYSAFAWETTETGVATFDLADDDYSVSVHMVPGDQEAIAALPAAQDLTVPDETSLEFQLQPAQNTVQGSVEGAGGSAMQTEYAVWGATGEAFSTGETNANGSFSIDLPAGEYMMTFDATDTSTQFEPIWIDFENNSGDTLDLGTVTATSVEADQTSTAGLATLSGTVTDSDAAALNCQSVVGIQTNGDGWFYATTNADGNWSASVAAGDWLVQGVPTGLNVCSDGVELGSMFVPSNGPIADIVHPLATGTARAQLTTPLEVILEDGETETVNFSFTTADATLSGAVRLASSHENAGAVASDFHGIVMATTASESHLYENTVWGWARAGTFALDVPASPSGGYTLTAISVPFGGAYNAVASGQYVGETITTDPIEVASGESVTDASVYMLPNDASISGQIRNWPSEQYFAMRICAINRHDTQVCTVTREASYELPVAAGVWSLNTIVPANASVVPSTSATQRVTVAAGEQESLPITLDETDATLTGTVEAPSGVTLADASVTIIGEDGQLVHDRTDDAGVFSVQLPSGYYAVHAQPGNQPGLTESAFTQLNLDDGESESITLTVVSETPTTTPVVSTQPDAQVRVVPAHAQSYMTLEDGFALTMPPYSVTPNADTLTVRVSPVDQQMHSEVYSLLSYGYELDVRTQEGIPVSAFSDGVTVTVPYDGDEVTANGWSESDLTLALYRNGAWEPVNGAIVHTTGNTVSAQVQKSGTLAVVTSPLMSLDELDFSRPNIENLRVPTGSRGDTWARVKWDPVLDDKTVEIQVWNKDRDVVLDTYEVTGVATEKGMNELPSNKKFFVRARTTQNYGRSEWSDFVPFRTRPKNPQTVLPTKAVLKQKGHGTAIIRYQQPKRRYKLQAQVRLFGAKNNRRLKFKACAVKKRQKRCQKKNYLKAHTVAIKRSQGNQRFRLVVPKKHVGKRLKVAVRVRNKKFTQHTSQFVRTHTFRLDQ
jgi:hypothetical protein